MAEHRGTPASCPPHYWLITVPEAPKYTEVWTCHHCALQKEISPIADADALSTPNVWRRPRLVPAE